MKQIKRAFILFLLLSIFQSMKAQLEQQSLTLEDLLPGGKTYSKYKVKTPEGIKWHTNEDLIFIKGDSIIAFDIKSSVNKTILTKKEINQVLLKGSIGKIKKIQSIDFPFTNKSQALIKIAEGYVNFNINTKEVDQLYNIPKGTKNVEFADDYKSLAYTKDNNLFILKDNIEIVLTNDSDSNIKNGQAVHRNEFGINKGIFWSPNSQKLAFFRMDESMVSDYPLVDVSSRVAGLKNIKYPMAGMKSHQVSVGVYDIKTNKSIYLRTGNPKDKYLTNISWNPDSKSIYIAELNRGQDTCQLKQYDANTGKLQKILFEETDPKYVEPEHSILFLPKNSKQFIWQSKRDGFNHLYLYNDEGLLLDQITSGKWDVTSVLGFDDSGKYLFYSSTEESPIENHLYKINLATKKRTRLSKDEGVHSGSLSSDSKYIIDSFTSQNNPTRIIVTNTKDNKSIDFFQSENPYEGIDLPSINIGSIIADDGETELYYRMVKPKDFDPSKKYPVVIYVYGGPHSQLVTNSWMGQVRGWDIYMAEKGYIVFTLDNRGTSNRGKKFEDITHRNLGVIETSDQMAGVDFLRGLPYVDASRIGVHGWSFGGFMTLNLMLRHPDIFKVGVAGGPVTDWKYYEIMYGERYMDSPSENAEGYKNSSMIDRAKDLKGRLMLIHGDEDPVVVMQHSLLFLKSAIKNGTHPDFFVYPGHEHNMVGRDRIHLHEHITRYFDDFLK